MDSISHKISEIINFNTRNKVCFQNKLKPSISGHILYFINYYKNKYLEKIYNNFSKIIVNNWCFSNNFINSNSSDNPRKLIKYIRSSLFSRLLTFLFKNLVKLNVTMIKKQPKYFLVSNSVRTATSLLYSLHSSLWRLF